MTAPICRDLDKLEPAFRERLQNAIGAATLAGLMPIVTETIRTVERQRELYAQGRTAPGKIVTQCDGVSKRSRHQSGEAADVCPRVDGRIDWTRRDLFDRWGSIAEASGLVWGGRFKAYDGPHVEMPMAERVT
jgi:hypothetical protein